MHSRSKEAICLHSPLVYASHGTGRCSPGRQSVIHDQSHVSLARTTLLTGCAATASGSKRGERAHGSKGNPARAVTLANPADVTGPAVRGPGPVSVSVAVRAVIHALFYRA